MTSAIDEGSSLYNAGRHQECASIYFDIAQRYQSSPACPQDCRTVLQQACQRAAAQFRETGSAGQPAWVLRSALDYILNVLGSATTSSQVPQNPFGPPASAPRAAAPAYAPAYTPAYFPAVSAAPAPGQGYGVPVHPPPYGCYRDVNVERPSKTQAPARYGTKVDDYGTKVDDCSAIAGPRYPDAGPRYPDVGYSSYTPASSGYYGTGGGGGSMASDTLLGGPGASPEVRCSRPRTRRPSSRGRAWAL